MNHLITMLIVICTATPTWGQQHTRTRDVQRMEPLVSEIPDEGVEVPMYRQLHLPVIEVMINGEGPFRMGIDTGASGYLSMDQSVVDRLALEQAGAVTASDGSGRNARAVAIYAVATVSIGNAVFRDAVGHVGSYNRGPLAEEPIDGIIGIGMFAGATMTLDYQADRVRISTTGLPETDGKSILGLDPKSAVPTIDMTIAGKPIKAHIDARNMGGLTIPSALEDEIETIGDPVVVGRARTQFNDFEIRAVQLNGELMIGRHVLDRPALTLVPMFRAANIGSRVMEQFTMTFDMANNRVRFERENDEPLKLPLPTPMPPASRHQGIEASG